MILPSKAANTIQAMHMCSSLAKEGHRIVLFVASKKAEDGEIFEFYGVEHPFEIRELPRIRFLKKSYSCALAVLKVLREEKPQLVYGRFIKGCFFAALGGASVFLELHQPPATTRSLADRVFFRLGKTGLFGRIVTASHELAKLLIMRENVKESVILPLPNASSGEKKRMEDGNFVVGYAGKVSQDKGLAVLSGLSKFIERAFSGVSFEAFGRGSSFLPYPLAKRKIASFDVSLLPMPAGSLIYLGTPLKLLDYMSVGGAIVASDIPLVKEVLDTKCALLVPPGDLERWEKSVCLLFASALLRRKLSLNSFRRFSAKFTWDKRAKRLITAFAST